MRSAACCAHAPAAAALPGAAIAAAALVPVALLAVAFPEGGSEPFGFPTMFPVLVLVGAGLRRRCRATAVTLRAGVAIYALATIVVYLVDSPIGSNIARLGTFLAAPMAALLWSRRAAAAARRARCSRCSTSDGRHRSATSSRPPTTSRPPPATTSRCCASCAVNRPRPAPVSHRDPVHALSLGGVGGGLAFPARPRLGAPARHRRQPALLPRPSDRRHATTAGCTTTRSASWPRPTRRWTTPPRARRR